MLSPLTDQQWNEYEEQGWLKLGRLDLPQLQKLQERINAIMLGKADVDYDRLLMQRDSATGAYEDAGAQTLGFKGATLDYRKIQELEYDSAFRDYLVDPVFEDICIRT